ncbi:hypothetical protein Btru_035438 [Bulinus truncatus]|nr:hypothetical protein Btru_035438 [Bulinus truncatus]
MDTNASKSNLHTTGNSEVQSLQEDENVLLRSNREHLRLSHTQKSKRTPTAVVSEVFAFLSNPSVSLDSLDDCDEEAVVGDQLSTSETKYTDKKKCNTRNVNKKDQDSGFASLERHVNNDCKNLPCCNVLDENSDISNGAVKVSEQEHHNRSVLDNCWIDVSSTDQNLFVSRSNTDNEIEYDDLDVSGLHLCESDPDSDASRKETENGNVIRSREACDKVNDCDQFVADNDYDIRGEGSLSKSLLTDGSNLSVKNEAASVTHSSTTVVPNMNSDNKFITVDLTKVHNKNVSVSYDGGSVEEKTRYSSLIDSYYDFINDTNDTANCKVISVSSDDDDEENSISVPSAPSAQSEQDYDNINIPLPQDASSAQLNSEINLGSCCETHVDIAVRGDGDGSLATSVLRRSKLEKNPSAELPSDDSSDEDIGIYAESFRRSNWIRVSQEGKLSLQMPSSDTSSSSTRSSTNNDGSISDSFDDGNAFSPKADEVFAEPLTQLAKGLFHKRSDSTTTTTSEREFKRQYVSKRKCLIQRADSQQEYHRLSARVYDQDKLVVIERLRDSEDLGLHLLNSHPAFITSIDPGSPAARAGISEGQILVSVNDENVLTLDHSEIIQLIQNTKGSIQLGVANSDFQPVRDLQAVVMSGCMMKLGNSSFMKLWKKRFFILRQDNCLYYYKNEQDTDPLGAIPLYGYTISRHTETSRDFCFKAEKYGARTYYFMTDSRDQMTGWVAALTEAAARSKKRKESFLSVSSHNVSLPALDVRKPECTGFLGKLSPSRRHWRRRYCVLKDACVYYYKEMDSLSALGVAHLHGYKVDVEGVPRNRKYSFSLQPPEKKMRVFIFSADNETDKKRWVEALIHSIQRWVLADVDC